MTALAKLVARALMAGEPQVMSYAEKRQHNVDLLTLSDEMEKLRRERRRMLATMPEYLR